MAIDGLRTVQPRKISEYLLNLEHPKGGPKAVFFLALGFTRENPDRLSDALRDHAADNLTVQKIDTEFGIVTVVECSLISPDGRNPCIRSVWMHDSQAEMHRFVSAYPARSRRLK